MTKPLTTIRYGSIEHCERILHHEVVLMGAAHRLNQYEVMVGGWRECKTCGNSQTAGGRIMYG